MSVKAVRFSRTIQHKILIGFVAALVSVAAAWFINKFAFKQMLQTVDTLAEPDDRLKAVNNIFYQVITLEQISSKNSQQNNPAQVKRATNTLLNALNNFKKMNTGNSLTLQRIDTMKDLLKQRQVSLNQYLKTRKDLVNSRTLSQQIDTLGNIIKQAGKDSIVLKTQQQQVISTTQLPDVSLGEAPKKKRGFLRRLFGKKKEEPTGELVQKTTVEERTVTSVDTVVKVPADSALQKADVMIKKIGERQLAKKKSFENREAALGNLEQATMRQILTILNEMEKEVIGQTNESRFKARHIVNKSAANIGLALLVFVFVITVLLVLIMYDVAKSNRYRVALQKAKDEAERNSLARQRFLANMSHEIRTPLQSIIGYAEQERLVQHNPSKNVAAIYHSGQHLLQVVNEVLDYSLVTSGKLPLVKAPFVLCDVVQRVTDAMQVQAAAKNLLLKWSTDLDPALVVEGDAFRLKQILINLLGNAIKFTESGTISCVVSHSIHEATDYFIFTVEDTGIGIAPEKLETIFDQFEQGGSNVNSSYGGTGLGLSIVKALAELQQGNIAVKSAVNEGTTFTVSIPYAITTKKVQVDDLIPGTLIGTKKEVWIVDDDHFILELCHEILQQNGIKHQFFSSGKELLDAAWSDNVGLLITDIRMSDINGTEVCTVMKQRHGKHLPVAAFTAHALPCEQQQLLVSGFDHLLLKPFTGAELLRLVFSVLASENSGKHIVDQSRYENAQAIAINTAELFRNNTQQDVQMLQEALKTVDIQSVVLLLHRMAGRIGQAGNRALAKETRKMEIYLRQKNEVDKNDQSQIEMLAQKLWKFSQEPLAISPELMQ